MSQCFKCKEGIGTIVSRDGPKAPYCTDCFLRYCTSTVRDCLFQHCLLACNTPVAVAVSGGPNSMLLLRELGQLRRKAQGQHRRQHVEYLRDREGEAGAPAVLSSSSSPLSSVPGAAAPELLPFHLCEAELVIPLSTIATTSEGATSLCAATSARRNAVARVRASMQQQFDVLLKLVQQQPPLWVYRDEDLDKKKKKRKQARAPSEPPAAGATVAHAEDVVTACKPPSPTYLFDRTEVRVFQYSDYLPPAYIAEVRHALHASKLSLTDREALYSRVRQQVLCRAAQRVTDDYRRRLHNDETDAQSTRCLSSSSTPWYHLLLGDNAARCAIAALEAVVTGAGGDGVVHASAFRGLRHDVVCLRPMRTMLPKETVLCSRLHGITSTYTPALRTATSLRSMHHVLEHFVHSMMVSYRTMIFNVLNTVQKLEVHPASIQAILQLVGRMQNHDGDHRASAASSHTQKRSCKAAPPGRTAQQNLTNLNASRPPNVHHRPSAFATATASTTDRNNTSEDNATESDAAQCCVCGCPSSVSPQHHSHAAADRTPRQVEMFPVVAQQAEPATSLPVLDCFVCYACHGLLTALPASALGPHAPLFVFDGAQAATDEAADNTPTNALRAVCSLFQR